MSFRGVVVVELVVSSLKSINDESRRKRACHEISAESCDVFKIPNYFLLLIDLQSTHSLSFSPSQLFLLLLKSQIMLKSTTIRLVSRRIVTPNLRPASRLLSTAPPKKSRSWKSSAARWTVALGAIYWYNTSPLFAEEPEGELCRSCGA